MSIEKVTRNSPYTFNLYNSTLMGFALLRPSKRLLRTITSRPRSETTNLAAKFLMSILPALRYVSSRTSALFTPKVAASHASDKSARSASDACERSIQLRERINQFSMQRRHLMYIPSTCRSAIEDGPLISRDRRGRPNDNGLFMRNGFPQCLDLLMLRRDILCRYSRWG